MSIEHMDISGDDDPLLIGAPYHVYPVGEGHEVDGAPCWCKPQVVREPGWTAPMIVHNQGGA